MTLECSGMMPTEAGEHSAPEGLFRLRSRVIWLYPRLPRFKFKGPSAQGSSLRLLAPRLPVEHEQDRVTLSPIEKYLLIMGTGERCYWCNRRFGSDWVLAGRSVVLCLHWDHVVPLKHDGPTDRSNVVPACHICNLWKSARIFPDESAIRAYLEDRWNHALIASDAEDLSQIAATAGDEPDDSAPPAASKPLGKNFTRGARGIPPRVHLPEAEPANSGQTNVRQLRRGTRVRVKVGSVTHHGLVDGPSREVPEQTRVLLGAGLIPWRFHPEQLIEVDSDDRSAA